MGHERRLDRARRRSERSRTTIGDELREARLATGLSQRQVAEIVRTSRAEVSRVERGAAPWLGLDDLARYASVVGLDLSVRLLPGPDPVRDASHLRLLARLEWVLGAGLRMRREVPIGPPGDLRAWDALIASRSGWGVGVEAETRLRDVQAVQRRLALKQRDSSVELAILLVAATRNNRQALRLARDDLDGTYPIRGEDLLDAVRAGRRPAGNGTLVI
jgi:transcriptional regulator with XRE-family HTH domain